MSDPTAIPPDGEVASVRADKQLRAARDRHEQAVAAEAAARAAAADALARRSRRRAAGLRLAVVAAVVVAVVAVAVGWWARGAAESVGAGIADERAAQNAAATAIVTMLTADPAHADGYVRDVLAVSTGDQRVRIRGAKDALTELVSGQPRAATGQVLSSGSIGVQNQVVKVLVVAQTTSPELVGGDPSQERVGVVVSMERIGDRWLVAKAEAVS